jgi:probable F420-dependent oxidoreductase
MWEWCMKFGINIFNFGPGTTPESLVAWACFAEEAGYHLVMISDHVAITPDVQTDFPAPFYDPFLSLGWLASQVKQVEIGTSVTILPYRHPLHTARLAANLDQLSGGRFIFGVGAGWARQEFEALGVPFHRRGAIANEYLEAIKLCWANEVASYAGRLVSFDHVQTGPRPRQKTLPPIWVGGASDGALKRAARYGDGWHPYRMRLDWLRQQGMPRLRQLADAEGRPVPALCPRITLHLTDVPLPEQQRVAGQGTIDQVRSDFEGLAALGAEYILLDCYAGQPTQTLHPEEAWAMLTIMAEQVLDLERQTLR